jgi:hypothetical protein
MSIEEIKQQTELWLQYDTNTETHEQVNSLLKEEKFDELKKLMVPRIAFGTSGMKRRRIILYIFFNLLFN